MPRSRAALRSGLAGLLVTTALALVPVPPAAAQDAPTPAQGAASAIAFDIPPGPLAEAAAAWERASGLDLVVETGLLAGRASQGVRGTLKPPEALGRLLSGSGLVHRFTDATTAALFAPRWTAAGAEASATLEEINVEGTGPAGGGESAYGPVAGIVATRSATGSKSSARIVEVPQTINVVTADEIRLQGAQSVNEALRYTPGVRAENYGASGPYDVYTLIRGFRADFYLDGLRLPKGVADGIASSVVDPWTLERIEVLKGPASGLYGQTPPGGIINMVSKRPLDAPIREVQIQGGSFGRVQGAFDLGDRLDENGAFLYRLTGLVHDTGQQVDFADNTRVLIAPAVTWRPSTDTRLTLLGTYQRDEGVWSYFNYLPALGTVIPFRGQRISTRLYTGEPSFDRRAYEQGRVGYEFEHRLGDSAVFHQNLRYAAADFDGRSATTGRSGIDDDGNLSRLPIELRTDSKTFTIDNRMNLTFETGPFAHDAVVGVDHLREDVGYLFKLSFTTLPLNVFRPVYGLPVPPRNVTASDYSSVLSQTGLYAQDQIRFGPWLLTLGGRFDDASLDVDNRASDFSPASRTRQHNTAFTGRVGLTYLFENGLAPYASYATSFQPEQGVDLVTGRPFVPSTGEQVEAGVKYQPPGSRTLISAAAFDITQQNRLVFDGLFQQRQLGEVNVRGVEFEAKTEVARNLDVIAAFSYLEPLVTKSAIPEEVGRKISAVPSRQAALWANYSFDEGPLAGISLGAGVRHVGRTLDIQNVTRVPPFTLVDARLGLDLGRWYPQLGKTQLSVNAFNLFDETYVSQCDSATFCTYGLRRTVLATLSHRW